MSLKRNIVANYASQVYVTAIVIVMVPVYLRYMGPEAYGLVGFFAMLQGWLQLMDLGLTGALTREVTCYRAGGLTKERMDALLRALLALFIGVGLLMALLVWLASDWFAGSWLKASTLKPNVLSECITLMGFAASLRWMAGLYRGIINGWEQQVWLGSYNVVYATVRYIFVLPVFIWVGSDPLVFFVFQLLVSVCELVVLWWKAGSLLSSARSMPSFQIEPLRAMWSFSGALAFTSMAWLLITQADKLVLSKTLTLADYGYFTMAIAVANGVNIIASPISGALLPRLTFMVTQNDMEALHNLYRNATQWVSVVVWPVACTVAFFAYPLVLAWTNSAIVAHKVAPVLFWYALGNACLGVTAFQYYIQFAHGKLRLHVIGNAAFIITLIPGVVWASINFGAVGAGRMWFVENLLFFLIWTWIVHSRFAPGMHFQWLFHDVLPIAIVTIVVSWVLSNIAVWPTERFYQLPLLLGISILTLLSACLASSSVRARFLILQDNY